MKKKEKAKKDCFPSFCPLAFNSKKIFSVLGEFFGLALALFFLFYLLPKLPFVTESYHYWLPVGFVAAVASFVIKVFKHLVDFARLKNLLEVFNLLVSLYSTKQLVLIFPFDFARINQPALNDIFRFALTMVLLALVVAILVNLIRIIVPKRLKIGKKKKK